jgi:ribosome-binding factor A
MATVYKVEVEIVSDWLNLTEERIAEIVREQIEDTRLSKMRVTEVIVVSRT